MVSMQTTGHLGHSGHFQVIGACNDFPATAPQWGRSAPHSPSGALLPILRLVVLVARRVCCAMSVSIRSEGHIVTFLFY